MCGQGGLLTLIVAMWSTAGPSLLLNCLSILFMKCSGSIGNESPIALPAGRAEGICLLSQAVLSMLYPDDFMQWWWDLRTRTKGWVRCLGKWKKTLELKKVESFTGNTGDNCQSSTDLLCFPTFLQVWCTTVNLELTQGLGWKSPTVESLHITL